QAARDAQPATLLAPAARMLGLGYARDRLALGRALALWLRVPVAQRTRQALLFPPNLLRSFGGGLSFAVLGRGLCRGGFRLHVRSRLCVGYRRFFGRGLLGRRLFGRGLLGRRLLGFSRRSDRTLGSGNRLLGRLFALLVLCLVVLFFVSHSSLDSRSLLVRFGQSGFGRSRAWRASAALCCPGRLWRLGSAG